MSARAAPGAAPGTSMPRPDTGELMLRLQKVKRLDMRIAVEVAGIANLAVRDGNGNLLPIVWTRQSVSNEYENATLLTRDALQKHLQTFIDAGVKENIDILQKVEDPALLVDWVVRTAEYWEKRYAAKRDEKYDISQTVYSAMFEAFGIDTVRDAMSERGFTAIEAQLQKNIANLSQDKNKYHQQLLKYVTEQQPDTAHAELESFFWLHRGYAAFVRMLFRTDAIPNMREHLCMLAGKLLQRKEVCNKAGAYSSMRQRSDVSDELNTQVRSFLYFLDSLQPTHFAQLLRELQQPEWIFLVIDHTALPVTLAHLRTPPVRVQDAPGGREAACPHCHAPTSTGALLEHKRRREDDE
jgi:hypothetical protein